MPLTERQEAAPHFLTFGNHLVTIIGNHMVPDRRNQNNLVFRAIADPTRRQILSLLRARQLTVGEIAQNFSMSRPAISKHLRLLRSAGLVASRQVGTMSRCRLNAGPLQSVGHWLRDYEAFWAGTLRGLQSYVENTK
jgi:DNA-binding transcriptional ArsR family regulator